MSDEEDTCTGVDMVFPCRCPGCTAKRDRKREDLEAGREDEWDARREEDALKKRGE